MRKNSDLVLEPAEEDEKISFVLDEESSPLVGDALQNWRQLFDDGELEKAYSASLHHSKTNVSKRLVEMMGNDTEPSPAVRAKVSRSGSTVTTWLEDDEIDSDDCASLDNLETRDLYEHIYLKPGSEMEREMSHVKKAEKTFIKEVKILITKKSPRAVDNQEL